MPNSRRELGTGVELLCTAPGIYELRGYSEHCWCQFSFYLWSYAELTQHAFGSTANPSARPLRPSCHLKSSHERQLVVAGPVLAAP
jgi:hypothetical protein